MLIIHYLSHNTDLGKMLAPRTAKGLSSGQILLQTILHLHTRACGVLAYIVLHSTTSFYREQRQLTLLHCGVIAMPEIRPEQPDIQKPQPWQASETCVKHCHRRKLCTTLGLSVGPQASGRTHFVCRAYELESTGHLGHRLSAHTARWCHSCYCLHRAGTVPHSLM